MRIKGLYPELFTSSYSIGRRRFPALVLRILFDHSVAAAGGNDIDFISLCIGNIVDPGRCGARSHQPRQMLVFGIWCGMKVHSRTVALFNIGIAYDTLPLVVGDGRDRKGLVTFDELVIHKYIVAASMHMDGAKMIAAGRPAAIKYISIDVHAAAAIVEIDGANRCSDL